MQIIAWSGWLAKRGRLQVYNTSAVILMATGGGGGGGYHCSQGLLYGMYCSLLVMHGIVNSFGGELSH